MTLRLRAPMLAAAVVALASQSLLTSGSAMAQYANPVINESRDRSPCRDPWINIAFTTVIGRKPRGSGDSGECFYKLYVGGSWNNYNELVNGIRSTLNTLRNNNRAIVGFRQDTVLLPVTPEIQAIIDNDSAGILSNNGGNIIANNGARLIGNNSATLTFKPYNASRYGLLSAPSVINLGRNTIKVEP